VGCQIARAYEPRVEPNFVGQIQGASFFMFRSDFTGSGKV
jgi:hypothetical protein